MKLDEFLGRRREEILRVAAKHGASNVCVFGSFARGDAGELSDIDFLVDMQEESTLLVDRAGLLVDLEELLGRKVDVATESALRPQIRERVVKEAVHL